MGTIFPREKEYRVVVVDLQAARLRDEVEDLQREIQRLRRQLSAAEAEMFRLRSRRR